MIKKMAWGWEQLDDVTQRAKVIGGWLVRTIDFDPKLKLMSCSTVFVEDHDHGWTIIKPMVDQAIAKKEIAMEFKPASRETNF